MSTRLYTNYKGNAVTKHSYSGGSTFRFCRRRYQLEKSKGWREKDNKAAQRFGRCIEDAIQFHVVNKLAGGEEHFVNSWAKIQAIPDLVYTEKEGDWSSLDRMGRTMLKLFQQWWPKSGLANPKWQLEYKKEVFPGDPKYAGLEFTSFVDLRADYRDKPLIVDIKTAAHGMSENQAMLQLDPQLGDYSWVTGIPTVGFLNLIKGGNTFKKGDSCTVISTGEQRKVCVFNDDTKQALLLSYPDYVDYEREAKGVRGNALKDLKAKWEEGVSALKVHVGEITKCRIQFLTCEIQETTIRESGETVAQDIVNIVDANERNYWPQDGRGIRFPNNNCTICPMIGICIGDDKLRDEKLINISAAKAPVPANEDWLDKLRVS
jgi:hypothetical protein